MRPEEELKRLNRLIRQFESVQKSTTDPLQRDRVSIQLKKLKTYREKVESFHIINKEELIEIDEYDEFQNYPFLEELVEKEKDIRSEQKYIDREVMHFSLYIYFFEKEFLALLSGTKLKLDFKHSLERDSFYHRFQNMRRQMHDFEDDTSRINQYEGKHEEDMRMRSFKKKRNLVVEADRLFRALNSFAGELIEDIKNDGLKCLNSNDLIQFDKIEGIRYLAGFPVREALVRLNKFAKEVVSFLNVPQIEPQEK